MASSSSSRRRRRDLDLEEGEYVPGGYESTDTDDDDDSRFVVRPRGEEEEEGKSEDRRGGRRLLPSPTPSCESDGTISDDGNRSPSSVVAALVRVYACHVCAKEFGSPKAVDGHMRVHDPRGRHGQHQGKRKEELYVPVNGGWAATGKRGWTGSKGKAAVSSNAQLMDRSMDIVVAESNKRPLEPMPMTFAVTNLSSASARTNNILDSGERSSAQLIRSESTATNPSTEPVVHQSATPPPSAQQVQVVHQPVPPPPASQQGQVVHQLPGPPPAAQQGQLVHQPAAPRREYTCKECGRSFPTHQGLGGHAAGHMNRRKEDEAAAAAAGILPDGSVIPAACRRGAKEETTTHPCKRCHKVFTTGVALGGHMRMHYTGPPIVHRKSKKRCLAPPVVVVAPPPPAPVADAMADHRLTLALSIKAEERSPAPAVAGRVRLFGIDIGPHVQAPSEQQGCSTTGGSPSEQQQGSGTTVTSPLEQQGSSTAVASPSEQQRSGTAVGSPSEQQGSGITAGSPSEQQAGSGTTVASPSEQQGSGKAVGSSSASGQQ